MPLVYAHTVLISVESMSKATSLKSARDSGGAKPRSETANNGLHQTGREGAARHPSEPVVEARPAGEAGC